VQRSGEYTDHIPNEEAQGIAGQRGIRAGGFRRRAVSGGRLRRVSDRAVPETDRDLPERDRSL
jgi:hypothetical protein